MVGYRELFLETRKEILQDFVREVSLSDQELIAKYRPYFQKLSPPTPKGGVKNEFYTLTTEGTFGYIFEEARYIRVHLTELLLGDLWELLCHLDRELGQNEKRDFPYRGQARRTLEEIERDPPTFRRSRL